LIGGATAKWEEAAYIQIRIQGFIGGYALGASFAESIATIKALCGLGIAIRLFAVDRKYNHFQSKVKAFVHRNIDGVWAIERRYSANFNGCAAE